MLPKPTAAVLLAAGFSRRLGRPKQDLVLAGEPLTARAVRIATEAGLSPVIAVVRPSGDFGHALQQLGCLVALNDEAEEGIAASIRRGVRVAGLLQSDGVVLLTCDQVALSSDHLKALCDRPAQRTGSAYAGKIGIPAYFPARDFPALLALQGDTGARDLLREARSITNETLALDIDTEADLAHARKLFEE